ncbi:hypothetical protein WSK_3133 [Novosphingobium sp. Rr 2-17]|uniref:hypothetical protein n=1 Tax=Novosphingobium sp. Rr 2-17 TaxID=555793 RepID=UPI000269822A|nr:hypothetical protein [Novosphingobium sp. Rr 2-17]EIZ78251.1 hypothetical protein WSK_3133 [Novosphingobium sp. Rr 2-17]
MAVLKNIGIGCGVIFAGFVGLGILGAIITPNKSATNDPGSSSSVASADTPETAETSEPETKWSYSENKDELRGSTTYLASIASENTVEFGFPYTGDQHLTITMRKGKAFGDDVYFEIERGQFICGIYDCDGTISFDGKAEKLSLVPPEDHSTTILFAKHGSAIIKKLKAAKKVVVELQFYQEGNRQFTFETAGLKWEH